MEARRFDAWARALARGRALKGLVGGGVAAVAAVNVAGAQDDDTANAGNGGVATASANGGTVTIGDINAGGNTGNTIVVGNTGGDGGACCACKCCGVCPCCLGGDGDASVVIDGGSVTTTTSISVSADGGQAFADASGGDNNVAFAS